MLLFQQLIGTQLIGNYYFSRFPRNYCCQSLSLYLTKLQTQFPQSQHYYYDAFCVDLLWSFCHCDSTTKRLHWFLLRVFPAMPTTDIQACEAHTPMFPLCWNIHTILHNRKICHLVSEFNTCLTNGWIKQVEENTVHYSETLLTHYWKIFNMLLLTFTFLDSYSV
jgi:hypothetical protein